jgi:catechol 2,3-dioxygenase-like lactoylglutathione lyase family enzyme
MHIEDIEYVIFSHPDLSAVCEFMIDYGLLDIGKQGDTLYLRSYGDAPFSYVTTQGEAAFVGMGFRVADQDGLAQLAAGFSAEIEDCPHPGGGKYFHTTDPEGRRLEFVCGAERAVAVPSGGEPVVWNDAHGKRRLGRYQRPEYGPSHVQRLGHLAIFSPAPQQMIAWYCEKLGMKPSELIHDGNDEANVMASFMHLDRGPEWTDHHTLAIVGGPAPGLDHVSFECRDIDDLGIGHMVMLDKGHNHRWGIGRHFHGSQIFDYWTDPAGFHVEHYSDGDLVNEDSPTLRFAFGRDTLLQWGPAFPGL